MTYFIWPILFTIAVWWLGTGIVLLLDRRDPCTFRWSMAGATFLALLAFVATALLANDTSIEAAYAGFLAGIVLWGWQELAFLTGFAAGPRVTGSPVGIGTAARFTLAVRAILYHELALLAVGVLILALSWDAPNQVCTWTFGSLWVMRLSAKLNIFFGVRNPGEPLLPPHLVYLSSYFGRASINGLFPISVMAATVAVYAVSLAAMAAIPGSFDQAALIFLAALLALGLLEHWFLVLPLPSEALWIWNAPRPTERAVGPEIGHDPAGLRPEPVARVAIGQ